MDKILANTECCTNEVSMLGQRLRRWPKIKPALVQHLTAKIAPIPSIVRQQNAQYCPDLKFSDIVFFSADYLSLGST